MLANFRTGATALVRRGARHRRTGRAQTPEQFFKGKSIDFEIGYPTGGSNDAYARLIATHLGKYIPGAPSIVPRNAPGAGSFLAVNRVYANSPKDGTVLGSARRRWRSTSVSARRACASRPPSSTGSAASIRSSTRDDVKTSPVKTIADAQRIQSTLSGTGAGSTVSIYPTVLNNMIATKFKLVMGYRGSNEGMLAMERGEVEGHSTAWSALKVAHPDWVRDKTVNIIVQFALKRHAELPDVPTAVELGRTDEERQVLSAIMNASEVGTAIFTTPGVPADRLAALRRAFDASHEGSGFLADAEGSGSASRR